MFKSKIHNKQASVGFLGGENIHLQSDSSSIVNQIKIYTKWLLTFIYCNEFLHFWELGKFWELDSRDEKKYKCINFMWF